MKGANVEAQTKVRSFPFSFFVVTFWFYVYSLMCTFVRCVWLWKDGATALFLAAQKGHVHAIKILAYWKAAIETKNKVRATLNTR